MASNTSGKTNGIRLQKIIAQAGIASRRAAEGLILEGKVAVNGEVVTELGVRANPETDEVTVEGIPVEMDLFHAKRITLLLNKPRGVMCTANDPEGRKTVYDLLDEELPRLFTVGRLDYNTEGVILLTNDGDLANKLTHPRFHVAKTYHVKVQGSLSQEAIRQLRKGVLIDGRRTLPADVEELGALEQNQWYEVVLVEGRNRQIHRMMEAVGVRVSRLKRVQFGNITNEGVNVGAWRSLSKREIEGLLQGAPAVGVPSPPKPRLSSPKKKTRSRNQSRSNRTPRDQQPARKGGGRRSGSFRGKGRSSDPS